MIQTEASVVILGIDPGGSGALSWIPSSAYLAAAESDLQAEVRVLDLVFERALEPFARKFGDLSEADIYKLFLDVKLAAGKYASVFAYLEQVHAFPKQGVSSTFKFGQSYGFLRGLLTALKIPFEMVTPNKWQKALGCQSGRDKNVTKAAAQRLFPEMRITHATADALLIATYGMRLQTGQLSK